MKANVHSGWGKIDYDGETYDVEDGTLEADEAVIEALHERYGEKVTPVDDSAEAAPTDADNSEDTDYAAMDYAELRQLAADAETDAIDGRSSKADIVAYFS